MLSSSLGSSRTGPRRPTGPRVIALPPGPSGAMRRPEDSSMEGRFRLRPVRYPEVTR